MAIHGGGTEGRRLFEFCANILTSIWSGEPRVPCLTLPPRFRTFLVLAGVGGCRCNIESCVDALALEPDRARLEAGRRREPVQEKFVCVASEYVPVILCFADHIKRVTYLSIDRCCHRYYCTKSVRSEVEVDARHQFEEWPRPFGLS